MHFMIVIDTPFTLERTSPSCPPVQVTRKFELYGGKNSLYTKLHLYIHIYADTAYKRGMHITIHDYMYTQTYTCP